MLKESPDDAFLLYALAIEIKHEQADEALQLLEKLHELHKNYLPQYLTTAQLLLDNGKKESAKYLLKEGLIIAQQQDNFKAKSEIQSLLTNLEMEEYDD